MKGKLKRDTFDIFSGNFAKKGSIFTIIEEFPEAEYVSGDFTTVGSRFTMSVSNFDFEKIENFSLDNG